MEIRSVGNADVADKRVLWRVVLNVPLEDGEVKDDTRLKAILPTLNFLRQHGAKEITIIGYVGRPGGKVVEELRVAPVVKRLGELTEMTGVTVLENLRFDPREEANDESLAKELSSHGDIFVNDAFADSHRAYASIVGVTKFLPSYAGLLMEEEVKRLSRALTPPRESIAIIGGAKYETKAPLIAKLANLYSKVFIGGAIANEFMPEQKNVFLPLDGIRDATHVADIGPETQIAWARDIGKADFVLWNGPVGMYEDEGFKAGTDAIAAAIAGGHAQAIIGGGDTIAAIKRFDFNPEKVFISTGGGAMLEFLTKDTLPGLEVLISHR